MFEKEILALSIEGDSVRAVQTRGKQILRWGTRPLQPGWVQDGQVHDLQEVGTAIDDLLLEEKFSRNRVVVGISGLRAISRVVTLPKMQSSLLPGAVTREARREMPVPLDEIYLSWQVIRDRGTQQDVFVVGVPKELLDASLQALQVAGLRPDAMDLKPMALARLAGQSRAVVASFEVDCLETAIVVDDVPAVMRAVAPVGESQSAADRLSRMAEELASTIRFYNDSHKEAALPADTPLYLAGAAAASPALRETVEANFPYPIVSPDPPFRCPPEFPVALYAVNLGLAMKRV